MNEMRQLSAGMAPEPPRRRFRPRAATPPSPPDPEDDDTGRGDLKLGLCLIVGVAFWAALAWLLMS